MIVISKEEILKLADMSRLQIHEHELEALTAQLQSILTYAQRVQEVSSDVGTEEHPTHNVLREDTVVRFDSAAIVDCAPEHEANYFVVPAVLQPKMGDRS